LYNETPVHRDNFISLVKSRYFDQTTFNRIIQDFVVQGGDPDSLYTDTSKLSKTQHWIPQEFRDSLFHKKGALAMGRDDNPSKASFTTQFYLVQGKKWTDESLDALEKKAWKNYKIAESHRAVYRTDGGLPFLDQNYTVFGEIIKGLDLVDKLAKIRTSKDDSPLRPVKIKLRMLNKKEILHLIR
jgi:peptidyl-prolyl cis-trans isomerase B (cyclophilin B)